MTDAFVASHAIRSAYGLADGKSFDEQFSRVSLESIFFYVFASAVYILEVLFDAHRSEVDNRIATLRPHSLRWYATMAKAYLHGYQLQADSDTYDTTAISASDLAKARIVRYAVATEANTIIYLKVAGADEQGAPKMLSEIEVAALTAYINEIKDAGVIVKLINQEADLIRLSITVYLNPSIIGNTSLRSEVEATIRAYLSALPFDGVYRHSDLLNAVQAIAGVPVMSIDKAESRAHSAAIWGTIDGYKRPHAGYFKVDQLDITYKPYDQYDRL